MKTILILAGIIAIGWVLMKVVFPLIGKAIKFLLAFLIPGLIIVGVVIVITFGAVIFSGFVESNDEDGGAPLVEQYDGINTANEKTIAFIDKTDSREPCPEDAGISVRVFRGVDKVIRAGQNKLNEE